MEVGRTTRKKLRSDYDIREEIRKEQAKQIEQSYSKGSKKFMVARKSDKYSNSTELSENSNVKYTML